MSKLLTAQEVADRLSVHIETVRKWTKEGRLKGRKLGNGIRCAVRYRESDIEEWIDSSTFPTTQSEASEAV